LTKHWVETYVNIITHYPALLRPHIANKEHAKIIIDL